MTTHIKNLRAIEILDSRGKPTIQCMCELSSGAIGIASVPSGASTGISEAVELRDNDPNRYRGYGCLKAVANINGIILNHLRAQSLDQTILDHTLIKLDGTNNKSNLGANAILTVSIAFAKACAIEQSLPLYRYFAELIDHEPHTLPRPMINLFSGGKHAGGQVAIQDVQVMPIATDDIRELLEITYTIYYTAVDLIAEQYGMRHLTADEGGLAPDFDSDTAMLDLAVKAIRQAGYRPGEDVTLTLDVAASHFYTDGVYHMSGDTLDSAQMIAQLRQWLDSYPITSLEDGLAEADWQAWATLKQSVSDSIMILGDDLLCTRPDLIQQAIQLNAANALLLKVNQIGTLTEAGDAYQLARDADWKVVVSARSGETEDDWLADLAVGWGGDFIKVGAITQSERLAKYNRLLAIYDETDWMLKS